MRILRTYRMPTSPKSYLDAAAMDDPAYQGADNISHKQAIKGKILLGKLLVLLLFFFALFLLHKFLMTLFGLLCKIKAKFEANIHQDPSDSADNQPIKDL